MSEFWDAEAARFDEEPDHGLHDPATRAAWLELLTRHLPPAPARVADLGCATGTLSVLLGDAGYTVDGVDLSPAMLERARTKSGDRSGLIFVIGDAADPPLDAAAYDVVLCRHVLWALPDPAAALARWVELLRPDGRMVLVEGFWHTGSGLTAAHSEQLLRGAGRAPTTYRLDDPVLWGGPVADERYLVVA